MSPSRTPPSENFAIPPEDLRSVIRASAGTGKTFQLSNRFISLLRVAPADRILASTFTRKAAGEILERVLIRLARAGTEKSELKELAQHIAGGPLGKRECLSLLQQLTQQLHRLRISTLDAYFAKLASSYSLELGLPPNWRILDDSLTSGLKSAAIESVLRETSTQQTVQLMHLLDKGQSARSVSRLISDTVSNFYEVCLQTPACCWECFPEAEFLSGDRREELLAVIEQAPLTGRLQTARDSDCANLRGELWEEFLCKGLFPKILAKDVKYYRVEIPSELHTPYLELGGHCKAVILAAWKGQTLAARQLLDEFHRAYEREKQLAGGLQFSDVTRKLGQAEQSSAVLSAGFRLDSAVEHLLLDEFQDTSRSQWDVLRPMAEGICSEDDRSFFCVGDTKQAIYGWRGGEAAIFDTIDRQLPKLHKVELSKSYRSSPVIMEFVNQVMSGLNRHDGLTEHADLLSKWVREFPKHSTARTDLPGYVCVRTVSDPPSSDGTRHTKAERDEVLLGATADAVAELTRQTPTATIGILTRTNGTVGRLIYELNERGIEASEEGGNPLTDSAAVQLVLSMFSFIDHPGHTIARFHVANSPLGEILKYQDFADDALAAEFSVTFRDRILARGFGGVVHDLIPGLAACCDRRELQRLTQLADMAEAFDAQSTTLRSSEFVEFVENQACQEPSNAQVRVMTLHQAKGLEFDIVVLPEFDAQLTRPPSYVTRSPQPGDPYDIVALYRSESLFQLASEDLQQARQQTLGRLLQESICLLYVALTRAVHSVHILMSPGGSKNQPKTYAGLIRAALDLPAAVNPDTVLYELGDHNWCESLPSPDQSTTTKKDTQEEIRSIPLASPVRKTIATRISPSQRKAASRLTMGDALNRRSAGSMEWGTRLHKWLESVDWLKEDLTLERLKQEVGVPDESGERWLAAFFEAGNDRILTSVLQFEEYLESLRGCFAGQVGHALREGSLTLSVRSEFPFSVQTEEGLFVGNIDRLVLIKRGKELLAADVIDFKTDRIADGPGVLERKVEAYRPQLEAYRVAVERLFQLPSERILTRLLFLDCGQILTVPDSDRS